MAVNLLNSKDYDLHPLATIIDNCFALMQLFDSCLLQHVLREFNAVADLLAKDSIACSSGTVFFSSPPSHIAHAVFDDIAGIGRFKSKRPKWACRLVFLLFVSLALCCPCNQKKMRFYEHEGQLIQCENGGNPIPINNVLYKTFLIYLFIYLFERNVLNLLN